MAKIKNLYKFADDLMLIIDQMKRTSLYDDVKMTFADAVELICKAKQQHPDRKIFLGEDINITQAQCTKFKNNEN